ncbi:hypothetical protein SAMN04488239_1401, partial [Ruegeria marina]
MRENERTQRQLGQRYLSQLNSQRKGIPGAGLEGTERSSSGSAAPEGAADIRMIPLDQLEPSPLNVPKVAASSSDGDWAKPGVRLRPCGMRWSTFHRERPPSRWQRDGRLWVTISYVGVFPSVCCRCRLRSLLHGTKRSADPCGIASRSRSGHRFCLPDRYGVPGNVLGRGQLGHALQDPLCRAVRNRSAAIEGPWWLLELFHSIDTIAIFLRGVRTAQGGPRISWLAPAL